MLWRTLRWEPGMHVEHALAILERSARAKISINIRFADLPSRPLSATEISDGHTVFRAATQQTHLGRTTEFTLDVTPDAWDEHIFEPLVCTETPLSMPALESLCISLWDDALASIRPIRIRAFDLRYITLEACEVVSWGMLAGTSTTRVSVGGFTLKLSDIATLLEFAPNLDDLCIGSTICPTSIHNDLGPEELARIRARLSVPPHAGHRLTNLDAQSVVAPGLALLCQVLPAQLRVPNIALMQNTSMHGDDGWSEFLAISRMGTVSEIDIRACAKLVTLYSAEAKTTRILHSSRLRPATVIRGLVNAHLPIWDTVVVLSIDVLEWCVLVNPLCEAGIGLLRTLRDLTLNVDQSELSARAPPY
ncbi:hypothetical protein EXIGLDRAFT_725973 [Exidia glandulosa HHB12029]|uniref:F-box domain-containing protein n=1 Tax=Exidia glandulosa HHB12029 TaxID=1314781 RepID=A0A165DX48_EXIGL|nr:hypothetical protein EXIGLDRAFT_725973 [Exidia glandulosa HHB12029]